MMGQVSLGFAGEDLKRELEGAGFGEVKIVDLPAEEGVKGPGLFLASGTK